MSNYKSQDLAPLFQEPPMENRPIPFWSWNDKLAPQELQRQVSEMHEVGEGGYFMHARGGLQTPYLGKEWFQGISACIERGSQLGMKSWAYDENGWPSGFGDGRVNGLGEVYQQKYLRFKTVATAELQKGVKRLIAVYDLEGKFLGRKWEEAESSLQGAAECQIAYYDVNPGYVDNMDKKVVQCFLEKVYGEYERRLTEAERRQLEGFFTDEPQLSRNGTPWSFIYEDEYRKTYGEELIVLLPDLFPTAKNSSRYARAMQTRFRFWTLTTHLFRENFFKQIYEWCEARGWKLTGHQVLEETMESQVLSNGAAMPQYQYYHIPGMDQLGRHHTWVTAPVQLASAAAQCGRRQILAETFACCGWNVTIAELKWLFQWKMALGVNLLCQHLAAYSLRGIRKRDYPAAHSYQQPCWNTYRKFHDEVSRVGTLLSNGDPQVNVLVIHPMNTAYLLNGDQDWVVHLHKYSVAFRNLSQKMTEAQLEYHYGDATLMEEQGEVMADGSLRIGKICYREVVIPQTLGMTKAQVALLQEFQKRGGVVSLLERQRDRGRFYVDGIAADLHELLPGLQRFKSANALVEMLAKKWGVPVAYCGKSGEGDQKGKKVPLMVTRRFLENFQGRPGMLYYFVNDCDNRQKSYEAKLLLEGEGVELLDAATGKCCSIAHRRTGDGHVVVKHHFHYGEAILLLARQEPCAQAPMKREGKAFHLSGSWQIVPGQENLLTLDFCDVKASKGEQTLFEGKNLYVLTAQQKLLELQEEVDAEIRYHFQVGELALCNQPLDLAIENPEHWRILVNGKELDASQKSRGYIFDRCFVRLALQGLVVSGKNEIVLQGKYHQTAENYAIACGAAQFEGARNKLTFDTEIEAVYLVGSFGVKTAGVFKDEALNATRYCGDFVLEQLPQTVKSRYLEKQGFPFFGGKLRLQKKIRLHGSCDLELTKVDANVVQVSLNGVDLGERFAPPYRWHLAKENLVRGENFLEVTLTISLRNLLGPFHMKKAENYTISPSEFYELPNIYSCWSKPSWNPGYGFLHQGFC